MNKIPKISVIMGVYNDSQYLSESICSVLNQSFKDFEFIICNDCSTDPMVKSILNEFKEKDDRIKIIENKTNLGLAASLNKCIEIALGKYIARMDSDDRCLPLRFEKQYRFLEKNKDISVVGSLVYYINSKGDRYRKSKINTYKEFGFEDAVKSSCVMHPTVMMRKEKLLSVHGYTVNELTRRAEDYDLWCKLTINGNKIANLDEILFEYREDLDSFNKRRYKYRIQEAKLKLFWLKRSNQNILKYRYAIKPLIVGLIPKKVIKKIKENQI